MTGENIILCGFMGCGKSTVGKALAQRLDMCFIDMDEYIETRDKATIADMFRLYGEEYFRGREHAAVLELAQKRRAVIATGGGALTFERNVEPLRESGEIVYLKLGFEDCYRRIAQSDRPLARSHSREQLELMFKARDSIYRSAAAYEVDAAGTPDEIAELIINKHRQTGG